MLAINEKDLLARQDALLEEQQDIIERLYRVLETKDQIVRLIEVSSNQMNNLNVQIAALGGLIIGLSVTLIFLAY